MTRAAPLELNIEAYDESRREDIVQLLNISLGAKAVGKRDESYWQWKHEANPFGRSWILLAEHGGELVGVRALMRWRLAFGEHIIEAAKPVDTVTHPAFQRRGIFSQLTEAACQICHDDGARLVWNTPNTRSEPGYLKLGWQLVDRMPLLIKPLQPLRMASSLWRKTPSALVDNDTCFHTRPDSAAEILSKFASSGQLQCLIEESRSGSTPAFHTPLSVDFMKWRYCQHPHIPYYAIAHGEDTLEAVLIFRLNQRRGLREGMIVDILSLPAALPAAAPHLIRKLQQIAKVDYLVALFPSGDTLWRTMRRAGFFSFPKPRVTLACRPLKALPLDPLDSTHWSLSFGDVEGL